MDKVKVIYGSTSGNTSTAATEIATALGIEAINISEASANDFDAELLILGSSTWGIGELQDDWYAGIEVLGSIDLTGKKVAVFGTGDQNGFGDSFCDAIGIIADKAVEKGATIVGQTSTEGYTHNASVAERDGMFIGLALDYDNDSNNSERISSWVESLKK